MPQKMGGHLYARLAQADRSVLSIPAGPQRPAATSLPFDQPFSIEVNTLAITGIPSDWNE